MTAMHRARMQKEWQRLETDPPPGVTAWRVKDDEMHLLHANVRGPLDTPYEEGLFKLEVQVPLRFPCEPPRVKFLTPIHHPNIDSGGRICLDTLNMPPKGSWNPNSTICSVLTSIQQLMADPNPDDGLSADVTKQFRENREAFKAQAKQMTLQYAVNNSKGSSNSSTSASSSSPPPPVPSSSASASAAAAAASSSSHSTAASSIPASASAATSATTVVPAVAAASSAASSLPASTSTTPASVSSNPSQPVTGEKRAIELDEEEKKQQEEESKKKKQKLESTQEQEQKSA